MVQMLNKKQGTFDVAVNRLDALNPLKVLARGFSLCETSDHKIVKSATTMKQGEQVKVTLEHGSLYCTVDEIAEGQQWSKNS